MRVLRLDAVEPRPRRVAVGAFDGVHLGHREVIRDAECVLTFDPHPLRVLAPGSAPRLLTPLERKARLLASLGVRELVVVPFDAAFAARSAPAFVDEVLVGALGATRVSVGENFRFGYRGEGGPGALRADARFETRVVPLLEVDGAVVSSTRIRALLEAGHVERAARLLGEPYAVAGEVVTGEQRGRELGYPTANLLPDPRLVGLPHGVYACLARLEGEGGAQVAVPAAVSIGLRPTFETALGELIEAYLLDWAGDLYGTTLELAYLRRLRGEERFDSVTELLDQMARDVEDTRRAAAQRSEPAGLLRFRVA